MQNKWCGTYDHKGFSIWCPNDNGEWICEPKWKLENAENFKNSENFEYHKTIAEAKKWIREVGVKLKESDYNE